jgi:dTDP-4-amino-4,6-dideoxygalactose transaminase
VSHISWVHRNDSAAPITTIDGSHIANYSDATQKCFAPESRASDSLDTSRVTKLPFFDLKTQFQSLREEILAEIAAVCDAQAFVLGPKVELFEKRIAELCGSIAAVATSSGTDAQLLILMAMGIGRGDAVVTTPFTFFSTAGCVARLGAKPLFVDISSATMNLDPEKLEKFFERECSEAPEGLVTKDGLVIRGVIPVHLFGLCCDMDGIREICGLRRIPVIEDAAQALGAKYPSKNRIERAGGMSEFGFFSFYPTKNLGAFGDAGMAVARDPELGRKMKILRNHGMDPRYYHSEIGGNFRMDALQAAVLLKKFPYLQQWSKRRWEIAQRYKDAFAKFARKIMLPSEPYAAQLGSDGHIYHQFVIRTPARDSLREHLEEHGIGTEIYYPVALHQQKCFAYLGEMSLPESEKAAAECLALPIYPELTDQQVDRVIDSVAQFFN